jgi:hypothetical protein
MMSQHPREDLHCKNCGAYAPGAYCPECGQETLLHAPTAVEFLHEFITHYIALEGKLWRSLGALLSPGKLTLEYFAGRRQRFILPLRMFLTLSIVCILAVKLISSFSGDESDETGASREQVTATAPRSGTSASHIGSTRSGVTFSFGDELYVKMKDGKFLCVLPFGLCKRIEQRFGTDNKAVFEREIEYFFKRLASQVGTAMLLLLPLFGLCLKLAYLGTKRRYGEHLVFAFHTHAFWFLAVIAIAALPDWLSLIIVFLIPTYTVLALQRVYGGAKWATALRALAISLMYLMSMAFLLTFFGVYALIW